MGVGEFASSKRPSVKSDGAPPLLWFFITTISMTKPLLGSG